MNNIGVLFLKSAVVYAVVGMALGVLMAASHDHDQLVTHAHINLVGWVSFALIGLIYDRFRAAAAGLLPKIHFWGAQAGYIVMIVGIYIVYTGGDWAEPIAAAGSVVTLVFMVLFAFIVLRTRMA